jgi:plasmid stabilization system protein ParE
MKKFQIVILEKAFQEIENARDYYENNQLNLGTSFTNEVFSILEILESNPLLFPVKFENIREAVIKKFPFVVIFEVLPNNEIIILSIFHFRRNPENKNLKS